ncbi:MAG: hypothetical protein OXT65_05770 [Alphaproteobacteria bacterium]|nr:hypothetical protein [Alphaproteobacteria bacterium]
MKRFFFSLTAAVVLLLPLTAAAYDYFSNDMMRRPATQLPLYLSLQETLETGGTPESMLPGIQELIKSATDRSAMTAIAVFLYDRTYRLPADQQLYPNDLLLYSDAMYKLAHFEPLERYRVMIQRDAVSSLMLFEALTMDDGIRCKDDTVWSTFKSQVIVPRIKILWDYYPSFEPEEYRREVEEVKRQVQKMSTMSGDNTEICTMGAHPPAKGDELFLPPTEWFEKRPAVMPALEKFWLSRYNKVALETHQRAQQQK